MPTVGVLGGGQLGKMLATAAVSCAPAIACSCIARQLNMSTAQHHSTAWQQVLTFHAEGGTLMSVRHATE